MNKAMNKEKQWHHKQTV